MKKIHLLIVFFFFLATGFFLFQKEENVKEALDSLDITKEQFLKIRENLSRPEIYLSSSTLFPGDTFLIKITNLTKEEKVEGELISEKAARKINFFPTNNSKNDWLAVVGISPREKPQKQKLIIQLPDGEVFEKEIEIKERKFLVEEFLVSEELKKEGYTQAKIVEDFIKKEKPILDEVFAIFTPEIYFKTPFSNPLKEMKVVGEFGVLRKSKESSFWHLGVDLEAKVGTPVFAINNGKIVLTEEFNNFGKTLIIDHGGGIFSLYLHLSEFKVKEGDFVEKKQIVAFSGNTGYSLGPHLHFSIKVNEISVDPLKFIETLNKDLFKDN